MDAIKVCDLFDLTHTCAAKMLAACEYPWEALSKIGETVLAIGQGLDLSDYDSAQGRYELYDVIATHDLWKPVRASSVKKPRCAPERSSAGMCSSAMVRWLVTPAN